MEKVDKNTDVICQDSLSCECELNHTQDYEERVLQGAGVKQVFILENLGCANCASKMETKIRELPEVQDASITFATKQLRVIANDPISLLPTIEKICQDIEAGVKVVARNKTKNTITKIYTIENLDCANCASKMETEINALDEVEQATITFATKQLRLTSSNPDELLPRITEICNKIEDNIVLVEKTTIKEKKKESSWKEKFELISIVIGAFLFVGVEIYHEASGIEKLPLPFILLFVVAYIILGKDVLLTAFRNIRRGQIFDENFLMSIATLGAFAIEKYPEAVGVMLFFRVGQYFEHIAVEKSRNQIMDAVDLRPEVVNVLIEDKTKIIPAEQAKINDIVVVRPGDRVPLDGIIIKGESRVDTSAITGESIPLKVTKGDLITSGSVNMSGVLHVKVEKVLEDSMVSRILESVENAAASKPRIDNFITRFSRIYTPIVVFLALITAFVIPLITGQEFYPWIYTALTFLVMSCPCALVLSVPLAFFSGIGKGSKKQILFKGGNVLETLSTIKAIVMDKTGTITKGNFNVQEINAVDGKQEYLLQLAASSEINSTHPIAESIVKEAKARNLELLLANTIEEISGKGIKATFDKQTVLCGNMKLMNDYQIDTSNYQSNQTGSEVLVAIDNKYYGNIVISDTIKEEAKAVISKLHNLNIETAMLTGDSVATAQDVASKTGIKKVYARLLPHEKLETLQELRKEYGSVMFVGDGINDAPVLANADVGAAMGSGADAAIEACDVVFMNSSLDSVLESIKIAQKTTSIAKQNVIFAIAIKVIVMILGITGIYSNMWLAVFADTGVAFLCILNSIRILYSK